MDEDYENAAFDLEIGEVSEVIESPSGYSVFVRCDKSDKYIESHINDLANDYYKAQYNILLNERIKEMSVKTNDAFDTINED
jgi:parvulin-like peptidyl-prolyl isomerase